MYLVHDFKWLKVSPDIQAEKFSSRFHPDSKSWVVKNGGHGGEDETELGHFNFLNKLSIAGEFQCSSVKVTFRISSQVSISPTYPNIVLKGSFTNGVVWI